MVFCGVLWSGTRLTGGVLFFDVFCGLRVFLCSGDRKRLCRPLTGKGLMSQMRNSEQFDEWIIRARARLAARRNGRPTTKSGAIRALWPEIQQALHSGQTLKTVRDWLEAEGVSIRYSQLAMYVRQDSPETGSASEVPAREPAVQAEIRQKTNRPAPEPRSSSPRPSGEPAIPRGTPPYVRVQPGIQRRGIAVKKGHHGQRNDSGAHGNGAQLRDSAP